MQIQAFMKKLGPGLLYAGAAIGVSHLVQSTRAGSDYGFQLWWIIIAANLVKYPFFKFGPGFATSTGKSLIQGYEQLGKWAIILYALLTIATMFTIQAAVTVVAAGIFVQIFGLHISSAFMSALLIVLMTGVLIIGKYSFLDKFIKFIIILLAVSTFTAVIFALFKGSHAQTQFAYTFSWISKVDVLFLIAFVGWMPAPIDVAVWQSLWTLEKSKTEHKKTNMRDSMLDFNIGYIGTVIMALGFLALGALVMYGTGEELSPVGDVFAGQLIRMYTRSMGNWAYWIIGIAALTTMISTVITCLDAFPRVLKPTTEILFPSIKKYSEHKSWLWWTWLLILAFGAILIIARFAFSMRFMVDLATTLSVVTAPFFAVMNYLVVTSTQMPVNDRPGKGMRIFSWICILILTAFAIYYLVWRF